MLRYGGATDTPAFGKVSHREPVSKGVPGGDEKALQRELRITRVHYEKDQASVIFG